MTLARPKIALDDETQVLRRGECPTLARPMQTGDGLLARLRPIGNSLSIPHIRALAVASSRHGNGILEITARGSLQIRGLRPETVADFETAVLAAGIRPETGTSVETPPLAGIDVTELVDTRPIAASLRQRMAAHHPGLDLAPKLAITVDGGGVFDLGGVSADVKATAFRDGKDVRFLLAVGGTAQTARIVGAFAVDAIEDAVLAVLQVLSSTGRKARGKDLELRSLGALYDPANVPIFSDKALPLPGIRMPVAVGQSREKCASPAGDSILGIAFPYCQASAEQLFAFADSAEAAGATEIRLAPNHCVFVPGLTPQAALELQRAAANLGFLTEPADPRNAIALCAGARGCASGMFDTHRLADLALQNAPDLLDGSFTLHLSGCPKGCAHPASSLLALVGAPSGYGLVVNGAASAKPNTYLDEQGIETALKRLAALVGEERQAGESAGACLTRLGSERIGAALQLEKQ
jgi:precorrin-3B synthase